MGPEALDRMNNVLEDEEEIKELKDILKPLEEFEEGDQST
jgi:hypothetical protein